MKNGLNDSVDENGEAAKIRSGGGNPLAKDMTLSASRWQVACFIAMDSMGAEGRV
jgi:hypothetical protein